jgi:hypothetical protein
MLPGTWRMIIGLVIAGGGIVFTTVSYINAGDGGVYVAFYGFILVGLWIAGRGAITRKTYKEAIRESSHGLVNDPWLLSGGDPDE